jgi:hypothetical protein
MYGQSWRDRQGDIQLAPRVPHLVKWMPDVADKDYTEAMRKMTQRFNEPIAEKIVAALHKAPVVKRRAKDLLDAVRLPPHGMNDPIVHKEFLMALRGDPLSPILLTQQPEGLQMVDGFHRLSFCYHVDPFMKVACKIA